MTFRRPECHTSFLSKLGDYLDVLLDDLSRWHRSHFVDEVLLCLISHGAVCSSKDFQNNLVNLQLDLLTLFAASIPDHIYLAFFDLSLVEEQPDEV